MAELPYDLGPIVDDGRAEERVLEQLKLWLPVYLPMFDAALELPAGATPAPNAKRGYFVSSFEELWAEETPPAVMVVSPGTLGEPELHGPRGTVAQWQQVNVTVTAGGATEPGTRGKAHRLAAAVRLVLVQQVPGDVVSRVRPLGQRYDLRTGPRAGPATRKRQRQACGVRAALFVEGVADTRGPFPEDPAHMTYVVPDSTHIAVERTVTPPGG